MDLGKILIALYTQFRFIVIFLSSILTVKSSLGLNGNALSVTNALGNKLPMPQKLRHDKEKILGRSMWMFVIGLILFFLVMFILIFKQMLLNFFGL